MMLLIKSQWTKPDDVYSTRFESEGCIGLSGSSYLFVVCMRNSIPRSGPVAGYLWVTSDVYTILSMVSMGSDLFLRAVNAGDNVTSNKSLDFISCKHITFA